MAHHPFTLTKPWHPRSDLTSNRKTYGTAAGNATGMWEFPKTMVVVVVVK